MTKSWTQYVRLTHWDRDKIADVFQMTLSNALSWKKEFDFEYNLTDFYLQGSNLQ